MTTATLERLVVRWVPDVVLDGDDARYQRLIDDLVGDALTAALDGLGIGDHEEVCIRDVTVPPVRLRRESTDHDFLLAWRQAIAAAVAARLGSPDGVVRYRSTAHALADLVCSVARGDDTRAWAWRRLGLWPADASASLDAGALARALLANPDAVPGAFVAAARAGLLARLLTLLGPEHLARVAGAAWVAGGGAAVSPAPSDPAAAAAVPSGPTLATGADPRREPVDEPGDHVTGGGPLAALDEAARLLETTELGRMLARLPSGFDLHVAAAAPLLVLAAVTELAARWTVRGATGARLVTALRAALARRPAATAPGVAFPGEPAVPDDGAPGGTTVAAVAGPDGPVGEGEPPASGEEAPQRRPARTAWAGLLFLVRLVDGLGLPEAAAADERSGSVPLGRLLHRLGTVLLRRAAPSAEPPAGTDPALLAFCGLAPDAAPPEPPDAGDDGDRRWAALVEGWADQVVAALRDALAGVQMAELQPESALLYGVCRRHGDLVADPGWIDVHLDVEDVSTDIRRAGLDLDPGHVPWLGCVLRFVYG